MLSRASFAVTWTGITVALPNIKQKASGRLRLNSMPINRQNFLFGTFQKASAVSVAVVRFNWV
jgi:hypothetical protein